MSDERISEQEAREKLMELQTEAITVLSGSLKRYYVSQVVLTLVSIAVGVIAVRIGASANIALLAVAAFNVLSIFKSYNSIQNIRTFLKGNTYYRQAVSEGTVDIEEVYTALSVKGISIYRDGHLDAAPDAAKSNPYGIAARAKMMASSADADEEDTDSAAALPVKDEETALSQPEKTSASADDE